MRQNNAQKEQGSGQQSDGANEGIIEKDGCTVGSRDGAVVGKEEAEGPKEGKLDGMSEGASEGNPEGDWLG